MDELLRWREEFPILGKKTYLINNSLGAMPRGVYDSLKEYADTWARDGVEAWDEWLPMVTATGDLIGKIFNAQKGTVLLHQNVSTLTAILASALEFKPGRDRIVYDELNFPSVHYVWKETERRGAKLTLVKSDDGMTVDTQKLCDAIDEHTVVVPISHVLFRSAAIQDLKPIVEKAHKVGAIVILDSYQATGTVPFDVQALDVDFVVGGSVKWLCGGAGACYLYANPKRSLKLEPVNCGWFSHADPFGFEMGRIRYAEDVHRFMGGSPGVPALYAARTGYKIIAEVGVEKIRAKSKRQTERIRQKALGMGLEVNTPSDAEKRGGTIVVDFPDSERASEELIRRKFIIDWRKPSVSVLGTPLKGGIRISPHFYNSDEECDAILEEIGKIRAGK
ncbi:MAG TPA: aminotransferase class V-fold PLP-dependent enzyme [bacterium]|nr:aminotransferase class V-fold PLP-dependent enzyme [bacterium]